MLRMWEIIPSLLYTSSSRGDWLSVGKILPSHPSPAPNIIRSYHLISKISLYFKVHS